MTNKIIISIAIVAALIISIFIISNMFGITNEASIMGPVIEELNPYFNISAAYWSFTGEATSDYNVCSNKSTDSKYEFTVIGSTNASWPRIESCYIKLNGIQTDSQLRTIKDAIKVSATAFIHFQNSVELCCIHNNNLYCSQAANLTLCELNLTEIEMPTGPVNNCNYDSDCIGYCDKIFATLMHTNCGGPYSICGSDRHCTCDCKYVNYKL